MITIARTNNKPDWNAIRNEYTSTDIAQRPLAEKYGVKYSTLRRRSEREGWVEMRDAVRRKIDAEVAQKTAEAVADNVTVAAEIQRILLRRLLNEVQNLPELIGTEMHMDSLSYEYTDDKAQRIKKRTDGGKRYKLTDLTRAYRDLTEDMPKGDGADVEDLNPLVELLQ